MAEKEEEKDQGDEFAAAFSEATAEASNTPTGEAEAKAKADAEALKEAEAAKAEKESAEKGAEQTEIEKEAEAAAKGKEKETTQAETTDDQKAEQRYKTLQGMFDAEKKKWDKERQDLLGKLEKATPEPEEEEEQPPKGRTKEKEKEAAAPDAEDPELKQYLAEYDYIASNEAKLRKRDIEQASKVIVDSIIDFIKPYINVTESTAQDRHYTAIKTAHPDFETYRDSGEIEQWILTRPAFEQKAMKEVYNAGSTQDIIDLISTFREAKGYNGTKSTPDPEKEREAAEAAAKKKDKLEDLSAVPARRAGVKVDGVGRVDKDDFAAGFADALAGK
jgi:hypothetical protein